MQMTGGVGSSANVTYYDTVQVTIPLLGGNELSFSTFAGFTQGMEGQGIGLLGQTGFFENFLVQFDHGAKLFYVSTK